MKKMLSTRFVLSMIMAMLMFSMPMGVFTMNDRNLLTVFAQDTEEQITSADTTKPTLNAAISDGLLSIQAQDSDSGIASIRVNGYEFKDISDGTLNVRLQQFDAGYQHFTIQAIDEAGNMSDVYQIDNPYYIDPEKESDSTAGNPAEQLVTNAGASPSSNATANVTEHIKIDDEIDTEGGKEFYTIQTATEKVFYLIIDRNGKDEVVYFLTEISENDLLNVTSNNSETLPKNSAAIESAIPADGTAISKNNGENTETNIANGETEGVGSEKDTDKMSDIEESEQTQTKESNSSLPTYIFFGVVTVIVVAAIYFIKIYRKKGEDFEDDDEDEEAEEDYENEDEEPEEDFFDLEEESEE